MRDSQNTDDTSQRYMNLMENLETMCVIIKETMSLDEMMGTLERLYSRDLQKMETDKGEANAQVKRRHSNKNVLLS